MDPFLLFITYIIFIVLVAAWATAWGRNAFLWGICAFMLSPLLTATALLIVGKTVEKKAEEVAAINALLGDK